METLPYMDMLLCMDTVSIYGNTTVDVFPYMETVPIYGCASMYVLVCPTVIDIATEIFSNLGKQTVVCESINQFSQIMPLLVV